MKKKTKTGPIPTKKWKNGTNSQAGSEKSSFSCDELCRIIELCAARGVTNFEHDGIRLVYHQRTTEVVQDSVITPQAPQIVPDHDAQNKETLEIEELMEREERLGMLMLENPQEYERQIMSGELGDEIDDAGDDGTEDDEA